MSHFLFEKKWEILLKKRQRDSIITILNTIYIWTLTTNICFKIYLGLNIHDKRCSREYWVRDLGFVIYIWCDILWLLLIITFFKWTNYHYGDIIVRPCTNYPKIIPLSHQCLYNFCRSRFWFWIPNHKIN